VRAFLADTVGILGATLRLAWRHWPVLLTLGIAAAIARQLVIMGAVEATEFGGVAGLLVFLFAPLALLIVMVLMLRTVRPSLPGLAAVERIPVLHHLGSVLVPFLVFYQTVGYLENDWRKFQFDMVEAWILRFRLGDGPDVQGRLVQVGTVTVTLLVAALVGRWLLDRFAVVRRRPWLGLPASYLEFLWILLVILVGGAMLNDVSAWVERRRVWHSAVTWWQSEMGWLGPLAQAGQSTRDWLSGLGDAIEPVLIVPLSAVIAAAVVFGVSAAKAPRTRARHAAGPGRIVAALGAPVARLLKGRFGHLIDGARVVLRVGALPMMAICVAFVAILSVTQWLWELERLLVGPPIVYIADEPFEGPLVWFNEAITLGLLMCLVAVAVDRAARAHSARAGAAGSATAAAESAVAAPGSAGDGEAYVPRQLIREGDPQGNGARIDRQREVRGRDVG
jgi:hypothetical protein